MQEPRKPRAVSAEVVGADAKAYAVKITYENGLVARPIPVLRDAAERYEAADALSKQAVYRNVFGLHLFQKTEEPEKARVRALIDGAIDAYEARSLVGAPAAQASAHDEPRRPMPVKAEIAGEEKRHWLVRLTYENGFVAAPIPVAKRPLRRYEEGDAISERAVFRNVFGMHGFMNAPEEARRHVREMIDTAIAQHETRAARRASTSPSPSE